MTSDSSSVISCLTAASMFAKGMMPLSANFTRLLIRPHRFSVASGNSRVSRHSRLRTLNRKYFVISMKYSPGYCLLYELIT